LRTSAANALSTIEADILKATESTREKTAVQLKLLNSGFRKRLLMYILAGLATLLVVAMAGAGMTLLARYYVTNLRQDLDDLNQEKAALKETVKQLQGETWGLTLWIEKEGRKLIILPPGATAETGWTVDKRKAVRLVE
jgi:cell division protein FtsB